MIFPILYKYTTKGQVQQWQIVVKLNGFCTIEGIKDGKLTYSQFTYCTGKNIGKSNQTSDEQQALLEAQAKWQKKLDSGYNEVLTTEKKFFEPMLAFEFSKYEHLLFTVRTFIQPKLDGMRSYLNDKKHTSRKGIKIVSCPHLEFNFYGLDGELYNHELKNDFDKLMSLVRKTKPTIADLEESKKLVQYWVYDYPYLGDKVFSERYDALKKTYEYFPRNFKLVPTYEVFNSEDIERYHKQFIDQGYEGSIIRMDLGAYENKRSKQLLKKKDFIDNEWTIIGMKEGEGNRAGCAATLTIKLDSGVICEPTMTGTEEFMRQVWRDQKTVIGKQVTVKYFGLTKDGSLRFPTVKHINDYN